MGAGGGAEGRVLARNEVYDLDDNDNDNINNNILKTERNEKGSCS